MHYFKNPLAIGLAACAMLALAGAASAMDVQQSRAGLSYLTGGVTPLELKAVAAQRGRYSFALRAWSTLSGGPVGDARVRITDASKKLLLDTDMDGPWLLATLVPGKYQVVVTFQDETARHEVDIPAAGQKELVVSFRSSPEVSLYPLR